jgi:hypothetical protein
MFNGKFESMVFPVGADDASVVNVEWDTQDGSDIIVTDIAGNDITASLSDDDRERLQCEAATESAIAEQDELDYAGYVLGEQISRHRKGEW